MAKGPFCIAQSPARRGKSEVDIVAQAALLFVAGLLGGCDPRNLVRDPAPDGLKANRTAQISCVLQAVALQAALFETLPPPRQVAGYSVGEVAA